MSPSLAGVLAAAGCGLAFLALPRRIRTVNNPVSLLANVAFALACLSLLTYIAVRVNGYGPARLGLCLPGGTACGDFAVVTAAAMAFQRMLAPRVRPLWQPNIGKLAAAYLPWAFVQQYLVMGLLMNFLSDAFGPLAAIALTGLAFGLMHPGLDRFMVLTAVTGLVWALLFQNHGSLVPVAVSHAVLATTYTYWVKGEDKWNLIFGKSRL